MNIFKIGDRHDISAYALLIGDDEDVFELLAQCLQGRNHIVGQNELLRAFHIIIWHRRVDHSVAIQEQAALTAIRPIQICLERVHNLRVFQYR